MRRYKALVFDLYGTLADIRTDEGRPALWREAAISVESVSGGITAASFPEGSERRVVPQAQSSRTSER